MLTYIKVSVHIVDQFARIRLVSCKSAAMIRCKFPAACAWSVFDRSFVATNDLLHQQVCAVVAFEAFFN
jgi:hypothetical protein